MTEPAERRWVLVTFGAGLPNWRAAAHRLAEQAQASGHFMQVRTYTESSLRSQYPDFWLQHERILNLQHRGFGYWIWKPFLIRETLLDLTSSRADGVLYLDAGFELNLGTQRANARWRTYGDLVLDSEGLLAMHLPKHPEIAWTSRAALDRLGLSEEDRRSPQVQATPLFANRSWSREFLDEWLAICVEDDYRFLRDPSRLDLEDDAFVAHRHDQSIFSGLVKGNNVATIPDETYWAPDWERAGTDFPLWAARNRTRFTIRNQGLMARSGRVFEKAYSRILSTAAQAR